MKGIVSNRRGEMLTDIREKKKKWGVVNSY